LTFKKREDHFPEFYWKSDGAKRRTGRNGESSFAKATEDKGGEGR